MSLLDKLRCAIGRHDLTRWRRIGTDLVPQSERHCKRRGCTFKEHKNAGAPRKLRPPTSADTVQGQP